VKLVGYSEKLVVCLLKIIATQFMDELRLSDYALIGNSCAAALVSKNGSIDWCCLPEFDSPAVFAALLDQDKGGFFSIAPAQPYESNQKYLEDSNVVETHFTVNHASLKLIDCFTAATEGKKKSTLFPDHELLRIVEGVSGTVAIRVEYSPRIFYGRSVPVLNDLRKLGIHFSWRENIFVLQSTLESAHIKVENGRAIAAFDVHEGQRVIFSLSYSNQSPAVLPELRQTACMRLEDTLNYWRDWVKKCQYKGIYHQYVKRSALALKLLAHAPSGSIIAAPTTSLPERLGGDLNWDYRFCWLRDASFTTRVLVKLGFEDEVHAYMNWVLHATQLTRPELQVVYSVYGHAKLRERALDWLNGYRDSKPVRVGNKAFAQFQLDVYGEVLDAVYAYAPLVKAFDADSRKFIIGLGEVICKIWNQPDNGIWEIRSSGIHHTHSKVMAWVGLDRLVKLSHTYQWEVSLEKFKHTMAAIRSDIEQFGYNSQIEAYTQGFNGNTPDASLLTLSLVGYCDFTSPRMISTVQSVVKALSKNHLLYRNRNVDKGILVEEGAFVVCNFWLVENLAKSGRIDEAMRIFEDTVEHAGPTGLLSEEIDPESHELLGNYPQGFSHIGLINAALSIDEVLKEKESVNGHR
jgi:GH15 family glucan-1,4-alpha-glucosidase